MVSFQLPECVILNRMVVHYTRESPGRARLTWLTRVQFLGDIHQPLHDENLAIGGNGVSVNFSGVVTNLHHVWDTSIPEKLVGGYSLVDAEKWGNNLTEAIKTGVYKAQAADWLEGIDLSDPLTTAMGWAEESNLLICTTVLPDGLGGCISSPGLYELPFF